MRSALVTAILLLIPAHASAGPWFVRGSLYCHAGLNDPAPGDTCWGWDSGNEMFDDGLHGDGSAEDGVFGAWVACTQPAGRHEFKIATVDWSENYPTHPGYPLANAVVFTRGPGDVVHFRLDTRFLFDGWQPLSHAVATDHALPEGVTLELIGGAPELGSWLEGVPLTHVGQRWQRLVTIAEPGTYEFKIRVTGTWGVAAFGYDFNNTVGRNATVTTTIPNSEAFFQLDLETGKIRGIELGPTPTRPTTWGEVKARYR